jgi:hypothetical protein
MEAAMETHGAGCSHITLLNDTCFHPHIAPIDLLVARVPQKMARTLCCSDKDRMHAMLADVTQIRQYQVAGASSLISPVQAA